MTWTEYRTRVLCPEVRSEDGSQTMLEEAVFDQLQGRLLDFSIEELNGELILHGTTHSYHVKQLAQCAVMALTHQPIGQNQIVVHAPHRTLSCSGC